MPLEYHLRYTNVFDVYLGQENVRRVAAYFGLQARVRVTF